MCLRDRDVHLHFHTAPEICLDALKNTSSFLRAQELCKSGGGRPGLPVLNTVSVDVKQHLREESRFETYLPLVGRQWQLQHVDVGGRPERGLVTERRPGLHTDRRPVHGHVRCGPDSLRHRGLHHLRLLHAAPRQDRAVVTAVGGDGCLHSHV